MNENQDQPTAPVSQPPPRGPSLLMLIVILVIAAGMLLIGVYASGPIKRGIDSLSSANRGGPATTPASGPAQATWYTCGMHPWVNLPKPGDCPICHMRLTPLDANQLSSEVSISPVMSQNIGIRVAPVVSGPITQTIRTVGTVEYDERLVRDINLKVGGWVEKLYADYVGKAVQKDQPLMEMYSPELFGAQSEYLQAYQAAKTDKTSEELLASARKRLENLDVSDEQIRQLQAAGKASRTMPISTPFSGTVVEKNVRDGAKVEPGTMLFRIADLSKVWIIVSLYEYQLPYVQIGQQAVVSLPYVPGQTFEGKVAYVYPYLSSESRQVRVRVELDNSQMLLKPGMFADVQLKSTPARDRTLVPREAVLDTGTQQVAFVSIGQGRFDPRTVKLGVDAQDGLVEVLDGLKPGDIVVTSGSFLLDSESRLRENRAKMIRGPLAVDQKTTVAIATKPSLQTLPEPAGKELGIIIENYFAIGAALAADSADGLAEPSGKIVSAVDSLMKVTMPDEHFWHTHSEVAEVGGHAQGVAKAKTLAEARQEFADMSIALGKLLRATGVPDPFKQEVIEQHCPMYRDGQGGTIWLQSAGNARNPYFGKTMLECSDRQESLPRTPVK